MSRAKSARPAKPRRATPWWSVGLAVVVVALVGFGVWRAVNPAQAEAA